MLHFVFYKDKKDFQAKEYNYFENYNLTPLDMYNPKFIVLNQKEESISTQRANDDQDKY